MLKGEINIKKHRISNNLTYIEFETIEESKKWGAEHYYTWALAYKQARQVWDSNWTKDHNVNLYDLFLGAVYRPLDIYCGYNYKEINRFMRTGKDLHSELWCKIAALIQVQLNSAPILKENIVTYRLVSDEFIEYMNEQERKGYPIIDKGFLSTGLIKQTLLKNSLNYGRYDNLLKLYVRMPAFAIYIPEIVPGREEEQELLLDSWGVFRILKAPYRDHESNKIIHECELEYQKSFGGLLY